MLASKKVIALAVVVVLVVTGIGAAIVLSNQSNGSTTDNQTATVVVTDDLGANVSIPEYPQRILSLGTAFTESLYAIGAEGQVVGVDSTSNYPSNVTEKTNIGDAYYINLENVTMLHPDLVIMWTFYTQTYQSIKNLGIPILAFNPSSVSDIQTMITKLGMATGKTSNAANVVASMGTQITSVENALANDVNITYPSVYVQLRDGSSPGPGTMTNDVISMAGGTNMNNVSSYTTFTPEYIVKANPDFIILENQSLETNAMIRNTSGWENVKAVVNDNIGRINGDWLTASPRIVLAIEAMAELLHPEAFAK
jgi:iron complex transport system substrate-binding protein